MHSVPYAVCRNVEKKSETHTCPICQAQVLIEVSMVLLVRAAGKYFDVSGRSLR